MALRFWTIRELVPVTDTCMGVRIKLAPRLIIVIIHKLKAFLLNKFLLNLARRYLSFVRYLRGECTCCFSLWYVGIVDWLFCRLAKTICLSL